MNIAWALESERLERERIARQPVTRAELDALDRRLERVEAALYALAKALP